VSLLIGRESAGRSGREARPGTQPATSVDPDDAVDVLRAVWTAKGQTSADLDELFGVPRTCKNMRNVGFGELEAADGGLREAWRSTLAREGKLSREPGSVRNLVFGPTEPGSR
jgi:hypothetical protein